MHHNRKIPGNTSCRLRPAKQQLVLQDNISNVLYFNDDKMNVNQ